MPLPMCCAIPASLIHSRRFRHLCFGIKCWQGLRTFLDGSTRVDRLEPRRKARRSETTSRSSPRTSRAGRRCHSRTNQRQQTKRRFATSLYRDVFEFAISQVAIEMVGTDSGYQQINVPIIIEVCRRGSHRVACSGQARLFGDIFKAHSAKISV